MASFFSSKTLPSMANIEYQTVKETFNNYALWLNNITMAGTFNPKVTLPLPIIGFTYESPYEQELLSYKYAESPYLSKAAITTSVIKEPISISIRANRVLVPYNKRLFKQTDSALVVDTNAIENTHINQLVPNTLSMNILANMGINLLLEKYCDNGGLFTLITPYKTYTNLALVKLRAFDHGGNQPYGIGYDFTFKEVIVASIKNKAKINKMIEGLQERII